MPARSKLDWLFHMVRYLRLYPHHRRSSRIVHLAGMVSGECRVTFQGD